MKKIRYVTWALIAILSAFLLASWWNTKPIDSTISQVANVGGPFELQRTDGTPITWEDIKGKPHALFFGFTHCPEICPTTLFEATGWLAELGQEAEKLGVYFITVDPERDTKEVLGEYMASFDPRIVAMTGSVPAVEKAVQAYRVYARKVPLEDGDYTVDHTASVFLMKADGSFSGTIAWGENSETAVQKLKNLIQ